MSKQQEPDELLEVSFTFLITQDDMRFITKVAKKLDRTRGYVCRDAIRAFRDKWERRNQ